MAANVDFHFDHMSTTTTTSSCSSVSSFNGGGYSSGRSSISCEINSMPDYGSTNKPHKANHVAWEAIRRLRAKDGSIGISHFKLLGRLGSGDIGNVYLCQLRSDDGGGGLYAMKVVDKDALAYRDKLQRAEMEKQILSMLDHPFLPTLYAHFDASHYSCLVMEFCPGGDLHSLRQRQHQRRFSLKAARFYAAEVVVALEYLHMMGIIYRDLKPENILVREDGHIMLSDFDLSLKCDAFDLSLQNTSSSSSSFPGTPSTCSSIEPVISCFYQSPHGGEVKKKKNIVELVAEPNEARSKSFVGTHEYLAPEIISGQGHGSAVDWYTLGIFIYELIYGATPFKGPNNEMTLVNILTQPLRFPDLKASSADDVEGLYMAADIIKKLLVRDPRSRLGSSRGAADIKRHPFFKGINWALIRSMCPPEVPAIHMRSLRVQKKNTHTYQQQQLPPHFDYF